ncbi:MAG: type II toxin-antitoxin system VapB family antitoxin [Burkholderiaceae bacterium]|jgi:Arc/MetJ family transcription regulator|nr:type II toxin-antitoxin system VapB family antitoxin [Burkholderiaceae bacterium]
MRTHVDLNDVLIDEPVALGGFPSKKAAIHAALADDVKTMKRHKLLALRGKIAWQGDLAQLRQDRVAGDGRPG